MDFSPKDKQGKGRNPISTGIKVEKLFSRAAVECVTYQIIYQIIVGQPAKCGAAARPQGIFNKFLNNVCIF
jgi:hypothetical protein